MPIPVGAGQSTIPFRLNGSSLYGMCVFGHDIDPFANDPVALAEEVALAFIDNMQGRLDANVTWGPVDFAIGTGGDAITGTGTTSGVGVRSDDSNPPNIALISRKVTATPGRRGRGRTFWPWMLAETDINEAGTIGNSTITDSQTALSGFLTDLSANGVPMALLHADDGVPSPVTALVVVPTVGTMRKRLRR